MHYDINYSGLNAIEKHDKAIKDIQKYLGEDKFQEINRELLTWMSNKNHTLGSFQLTVSFIGVQGYPAKAWYNYLSSL